MSFWFGWGKKRNEPQEKEYEDKMILISGLKKKTTADALCDCLMSTCSLGKDIVERVAFVGQEKAIAYLNKPTEMENVFCAELDGMQLTMKRVYLSNSVIISGLPPQTTEESICSYFEDVHQSGAGEVKNVTLFKETHRAVVTFENPQVVNKVANNRHYLDGVSVFVQKYFPQIDPDPAVNQNSSYTSPAQPHKDIISQFILNGGFSNELEVRLRQLNANIRWSSSDNAPVSRIWDIAETEISQWARSYQAVVREFLAQFEVLTIPFDNRIECAVLEALPQLYQMIPEEKAFCQKAETQCELLVACLKIEQECVSEIIHDFLEHIKKESLKKEMVKTFNHEHVLLLKKIGFIEKIKHDHANLEVVLDDVRCELYLEGPCQEVDDAHEECDHFVERIVDETHPLPYTNIGKVVKSEAGQKYLSEKMCGENVPALLFPQKGNAVRIVAITSSESEKVKKSLQETMKQYKVHFGPENTSVIESERWKVFSEKMNQEPHVLISVDKITCSIVVLGISDKVERAKNEVESFVESEKIRSESEKLSAGMLRFLKENFWEKVQSIEKKLREYHVSIKMCDQSQAMLLKGTRKGLSEGRKLLDELYREVVTSDDEFTSPGSPELFCEERGRRYLESVEKKRRVVIEVAKTSAKHGKSVQYQAVKRQDARAEKRDDEEIQLKRGRANPNRTSVYDRCNFSTKEGIKVSLKLGNIADEKADILVKCCHPDLKIPEGSVVQASGANSNCTHVLHAACCKWDDEGYAEKQLSRLVRRILDKCNDLGVSTVAMPIIGTHDHKFPEQVVLRILREEIVKFSRANVLTKLKLKEIQIVVSAEETACQSSAVGFRTISFGPVSVSLHHGDITEHPVDAIINVLPLDLQLSKGGGVCKSILRIGGKDIQRQLDGSQERSPGSVLLTNAGKMRNIQNILHFLPTSTDRSGLQRSIEKCFMKAKSQPISSVSIGAIGTAAFHITARDSVELILDAAKSFSRIGHPLEVNIVVFQKTMIPDFETGIQDRTRRNLMAEAQDTAESPRPDRRSSQPIRFKSPKTSPKEIIKLRVFGHSQDDIDNSLGEIAKFVSSHTEVRKIKDENVCHLLFNHYSEVENLEQVCNVSITCLPPSTVKLSGLQTNVEACEHALSELIDRLRGQQGSTRFECRVDHRSGWSNFQESELAVEDDFDEVFAGTEGVVHHEEKYDDIDWNKNDQGKKSFQSEVPSCSVGCTGCASILQPRDVEKLSRVVSNKWDRLARLLNLPTTVVYEIQHDVQYPDSRARASRVLEVFNSTHARTCSDSAFRHLLQCLLEIPVKLPEGFPAPVSGISSQFGSTSPADTVTGRLLPSQHVCPLGIQLSMGMSSIDGNSCEFMFPSSSEDSTEVLASTPLSPREIERMSREIPHIWPQLANLVNIPRGEVDNIMGNIQYPSPTDKAVQFLQLYNDYPSFNRDDLVKFLDELQEEELKEKFESGILRKR